jgi:hypothetical protein
MDIMEWTTAWNQSKGMKAEDIECPSRKAYRILRDEVRRLRAELIDAETTISQLHV